MHGYEAERKKKPWKNFKTAGLVSSFLASLYLQNKSWSQGPQVRTIPRRHPHQVLPIGCIDQEYEKIATITYLHLAQLLQVSPGTKAAVLARQTFTSAGKHCRGHTFLFPSPKEKTASPCVNNLSLLLFPTTLPWRGFWDPTGFHDV